ncbi:MAG: Tad domain-containing protein [Endomicrobiales bacterium]|nr:Tad domain-containing protein [Endomicrobiales bacterium]
MNKKTLHKSSGQVLPYYLTMIIILIISWAMLINISKLLYDRMMMQNAADNAALSVAVYKARIYNVLGKLNYMIGWALYGGEKGYLSYFNKGFSVSGGIGAPFLKKPRLSVPFPIPIFHMGADAPSEIKDALKVLQLIRTPLFDPVKKFSEWLRIGALPNDDQKKVTGTLDMINIISPRGTTQVDAVRNFVKGIIGIQDTLLLNEKKFFLTAEYLANEIAQRQNINKKGDYSGADLAAVLTGLNIGDEVKRNRRGIVYHRSKKSNTGLGKIFKTAINIVFKAIAAKFTAGTVSIKINDFYKSQEYKSENQSWLYVNKPFFDRNQKIVVFATKFGNSSSNQGFPLSARWLDIDWPSIYTIAAASIYNTRGCMFPTVEEDNISPVIKAYKKAKNGGWHAHLVPVGKVNFSRVLDYCNIKNINLEEFVKH